MQQYTGRDSCSFMGRRLTWFVAKGKTKFFGEIRAAITPRLLKLLSKLPADRRTHIVAHLELLRTDCLETLTEKMKFTDHAPIVALGAFYSIYDGDVAAGKMFLQRCFQEVDEAIARGRKDKLHRRTHALLLLGSSVRVDGAAWLDDTSMTLRTAPYLRSGGCFRDCSRWL